LYYFPNVVGVIKSSRIRWIKCVAHGREMRNVYRILVGKSERRKPFERPRCRQEDDSEIGVVFYVWTGFSWLKVLSTDGFF
jgi:hypothetical protein